MKWFRRGGDHGILPAELGGFLVVDVETTGPYNSDRVVEVAAITLSQEGEILDEWDTLVNSGRDQESVPAAHDLAFDSRTDDS